ncbi:unnamed protein product [Mytilus coruscus]|uniref:B box-type domain-containing protein n=1 Tax=Mytilus coruscus TaxID=42192 RepID=A0A6J8A843_MYTCO|nr:unnamed protein product [Mytilus coruscus]
MASNSYCESCSGEGKSVEAIQFCSDCEEPLCTECEKDQEIEFLKEHGSNSHLYLKLREQGKGVQKCVKRVHEMTMSHKRAHLKFKKQADIDLKSMESIFEIDETCYVQYSPVKLQQSQVQPERVETILTLKMEITNQLNLGVKLYLTDIAVPADNTLFLCNWI